MNAERIFRDLKNIIEAERLSSKTFTAYSVALGKFFKHFAHKDHPININQKEITEYVAWVMKEHPAQGKQAIAALRFLYKRIEVQPEKLKSLRYPKWNRKIPEIIPHDIILNVIRSCKNKKEKAILALFYGTGVRLSELCHLKISDVDSKRMVIMVHQGKGGKDRIVPMPDMLLQTLREYWKALPEMQKFSQWLFPGEQIKNHISPVTVQRICHERLNANPHRIRHSYATYLYEHGEELKKIGDILGHSNTRTTEIYTHTSAVIILKTINPLAA